MIVAAAPPAPSVESAHAVLAHISERHERSAYQLRYPRAE
jgi:hypothetical protein